MRPVVLDRIIQWSLAILVPMVVCAAVSHQKLAHVKMAVRDCVIDWILPVSV